MVGLLDIAPVAKSVTVNGQSIPVYGVSAKGVASLLAQFPKVKTMFLGGKVDVPYLLETAPDLCAAIIAAGTGSPGDERAIAAADNLGLEAQLDLLEAIFERTAPSGIGPFVNRMTSLINSVAPAPAQPNPTTSLPISSSSPENENPDPSTGTETSTTSPPPSSA